MDDETCHALQAAWSALEVAREALEVVRRELLRDTASNGHDMSDEDFRRRVLVDGQAVIAGAKARAAFDMVGAVLNERTDKS